MVGHQQPELQLRLAAEPESVRVARQAASRFAERYGIDADAVALAVSEAVTNAIVHAHRDSSPGEIELSAKLNGEGVIVVVADEGDGIKPNPDSPGLGFGLALVASLADEVAIGRSSAGGTAVKMRFQTAG